MRPGFKLTLGLSPSGLLLCSLTLHLRGPALSDGEQCRTRPQHPTLCQIPSLGTLSNALLLLHGHCSSLWGHL